MIRPIKKHQASFPVDIKRFLNLMDVRWTSKQRYTLLFEFKTQDIALTPIQRFLNVLDVRWTSK